jgi:hypothetical protein
VGNHDAAPLARQHASAFTLNGTLVRRDFSHKIVYCFPVRRVDGHHRLTLFDSTYTKSLRRFWAYAHSL